MDSKDAQCFVENVGNIDSKWDVTLPSNIILFSSHHFLYYIPVIKDSFSNKFGFISFIKSNPSEKAC